MRGGIGVLLCATLAIGCPSVDQDEPITESASTIARFSPDSANPCNSVMPYPTDLSKDPTTGLLALPFCEDDSAQLLAFKRGLNTLDGYSLNATMTLNFSGPVDPSTLDGSVVLLNATTGAPHPVGQTLFVSTPETGPACSSDGECAPLGMECDQGLCVATCESTSDCRTPGRACEVPEGATEGVCVEHLLTIFPGAPFDEGTKYLVIVEGGDNGIKDNEGGEIISDQVFTLLKSDTPLVNEFGYSAIALDDASAASLEQLRLLWLDIFAAAAAAGIDKADVLAAWPFTTQTVTASYPTLAALVAGGAEVTYENTLAAADHVLLEGFGIPTTNLCKIHSGRVTLESLLTEAGTFGVDDNGAPIVNDEVAEYVLFTPNAASADCTGTNPDIPAANWQGIAIFVHTLSRCKNLAVSVANSFGAAGWAVLAVDGPRAGARSINSYGDQDLDTCPDQPGNPEIIALGDETPNPWGIRDRMRQWGLEVVQLAELAATDARVFAGDTAGSAATPTVGVVGHSWGGMAAVLAGSVSSDIDVMAISAASGELGAVFEPLLRAGIAAQMGLAPTSTDPILERETQTVAQVYRWALEPADPLYAAARVPVALPVLTQVVGAVAPDPGAPLHFTETQALLGAALSSAARPGYSKTTTVTLECTTGSGTDAVCDDSMGVVAAPLQPCDGYQSAALAWTTALQTQMVTYIATQGTKSQDPGAAPACTP